MYSQNREEQIIADFFGDRVCRFLDVGAHDGCTFSNTLRLVEQGWSGVCVEPAASVFARLLATHRERPQIKLVNAALAPVREIVPFWDSNGDCVGTTDARHRDLWAGPDGGVKFAETWIQTLAVGEFLASFPAPYHFISIDVEGTSAALLRAFPTLQSLGCEMICVEYDNELDNVAAVCRDQGYTVIENTGENLVARRP